jgi:AcrR family transcriptional regulator
MKRKTAAPRARAYHHGDLKNALVASALRLIAANGARALSLREVARATGVSHASTYRHFPNKESVLATIAEQGFRELTQHMRRAAQDASGPLESLRLVGLAYVEFGVSHPHHLLIMFGDLITSHAAYPSLVEASAAAFEVLASSVRAGQRAGLIRDLDERLISLAAWSQVHGLSLLIASGQIPAEKGGALPAEALADAVLNLLQTGLAASQR